MPDLDGKIAFVTGAGSGLGREIALTFARAGARVAVNDLRAAAAAAVQEELAALGLMVPARSGRIINMASIAGMTGIAGVTHYSAAKGAIIAFTKALAREVGPQGILVNAIAPGYIDTPLLDIMGDQREMQTAMIALQTAVGRLGEAREIAATALFLAGPGRSHFTRQARSPNGGLVI